MQLGGAWKIAAIVLRRVAAAAIVGLIVVSITFVVVRVLPGNPAYLLAGSTATEETVRYYERELGLDRSIAVQYGRFLGDLASLDFGRSLQTGRKVTSDIGDRIPATIELTLAGLLIGTVVGLALGVLMAVREKGILPRLAGALTIGGAAMPEFWLGLILILVFYAELGVAPAPIGRLSPDVTPPDGPTGLYVLDGVLHWDWNVVGSALGHLILPAIALGFLAIPTVARVTRATMRSVLAEDFVVSARANGDRGLHLYFRRVLPVALPPIVTATGLLAGYLLAGDFLLEKVFGWPGIGLYAVNAVQVGDFNVVEATVLLAAVLYVAVFLVVDLLNSVIDPRSHVVTR